MEGDGWEGISSFTLYLQDASGPYQPAGDSPQQLPPQVLPECMRRNTLPYIYMYISIII